MVTPPNMLSFGGVTALTLTRAFSAILAFCSYPTVSRHSRCYTNYDFSVKVYLASSKKFACFFKRLDAHNSYTLRTTKVLRVATLGKTDKHGEKSEHKMITIGLCETLIHMSFVAT
jgi:hypothetical protein